MTTRKGAALEVKRAVILEALISSLSITEAAQRAGCSRKTIYASLNRDMELLTEFREIRRGQVRDIADGLAGAAGRAVEALAKIMDDEQANAAIRVQAASKILEMASTYRGLELAITRAAIDETEGPRDIYDPESILNTASAI